MNQSTEPYSWFIDPINDTNLVCFSNSSVPGGERERGGGVHTCARILQTCGYGSMTAFILGDTRHPSSPIINPGWAPAQVAAEGVLPAAVTGRRSLHPETLETLLHSTCTMEQTHWTNNEEAIIFSVDFCRLTEYYSCTVVHQDLLQRSTRAQHLR